MARSLRDLDAAFLGKQQQKELPKDTPKVEPIYKEKEEKPQEQVVEKKVRYKEKPQEQDVERKARYKEKAQEQDVEKKTLRKEKTQGIAKTVIHKVKEQKQAIGKLISRRDKEQGELVADKGIVGKRKRNKWVTISDIIFGILLISVGLVAIVLSSGDVEGQAGRMYDIFIIHGRTIIIAFVILMIVSFMMKLFGVSNEEAIEEDEKEKIKRTKSR